MPHTYVCEVFDALPIDPSTSEIVNLQIYEHLDGTLPYQSVNHFVVDDTSNMTSSTPEI
eukprot:m.190590 g.190590  ORF g.190590 m.190590 type:complete len:59 (-) comp18565_c0_seq1:624-800(-)